MTVKTIRLVNEQWQGGMNENYSFGARLLSHIVPPSYSDETETVFAPVSAETKGGNGIDAGETLKEQISAAYNILTAKDPRNVLTLGGDCSVSEAPFDYLHGKYPAKLGLIWLDAHPDVATPETSHHLHEMALADLIGQGGPGSAEMIKAPFDPSDVLLAGLRYDQLRPMDAKVANLGLSYVTPDRLHEKSLPVTNWIKQRGFTKVVIHWDLDVLDPADFHAILPAQPGLDRRDFGAAIGTLKLDEVLRLLGDISKTADIAGLTLAEHMPWDALRLRQGLADLPIFK
ncbi:arginase family protein [Ligilactobacillus acidipiscis]|uniref:arginase family protein n=1 Tax=Ligilactobacillus acidipiscis TaxID=89059 RepID=UPI00386C7A03